MKAAIVVPTIRPSLALNFLEAWRSEFESHDVILVEDNPERTLNLPDARILHFSWKEIDEDLGKDSWIIPRRTDCIPYGQKT